MNYEEKIIDGKLYFRTNQDGKWVEVRYEGLLLRYMAANLGIEIRDCEIDELKSKLGY